MTKPDIKNMNIMDRLVLLFDWIWDQSCNTCEIDGGDLESKLRELGFTEEQPYNPDIHGAWLAEEWGYEKGDSAQVATDTTRRILSMAKSLKDAG